MSGIMGTSSSRSGVVGSSKDTVKAWANIDGIDGSMRNSYGVSSMARTGTGRYTINFMTNMSNVRQRVQCTA